MNKIDIEIDLNYSINNDNFKYLNNPIIFPLKIVVDDDIAYIAASPRYYSMISNVDSESLEKILFKSTIDHLKNTFLKNKQINLFDIYYFSINDVFQTDNNFQFDNNIIVSIEVNDDLYKCICKEIAKYKVIEDKFEKSKDYLFNLNVDQVKYDISTIEKCFSMISTCLASSLDKQCRISDLDYIKNCFLNTKLRANEFDNSKKKLYSIIFPDIFICNPMIPNKIDYVYDN